MEKTKNIVIDYLNKGIEEKRNGNFSQAIDNYKKAIEEDPYYPVSYKNMAKVFIGIGKYEIAFRNLLTNIHLRLLNNENSHTPEYLSFYQINKDEFEKLNINNDAVKELIEDSEYNKKIASYINITFYSGLCYIGQNPNFLKLYKIKKQFFESEKELLLGKIPSSQNLRQTKFVNLINIIGLKWIIDNIDLETNNKAKIIYKYIDSNLEINKPDTKIFSKKKKNEISSEQDENEKNIDEYEMDEEYYKEWRESLGGKSVLEHLAESISENQDDNIFVWRIPDEEMKNIFHHESFEKIWSREAGNEKYTLFLMIYTNEDSIGLGDSLEREYYHCKLKRLVKTEGNYKNVLPCGIYEFEIINIPQLDFLFSPNLKHVGKDFYMDKKLFEELFAIPVYMKDSYDKQLRNTIGLEEIIFN